MEIDEAIRSRRSVRRFAPDPIPDALVLELIDLARQAPSSMNGQPWQFVVVRDPARKQELATIKTRNCPPSKAAYPASFIADAPTIVVVCVERDRAHGRGVETAVLATANLLLAAHGRGLGSVFLAAHRPEQPELAAEISRCLGLPDDIEPITLVPLGRAAESPRERTLRPLETLVHHDEFRRTTH